MTVLNMQASSDPGPSVIMAPGRNAPCRTSCLMRHLPMLVLLRSVTCRQEPAIENPMAMVPREAFATFFDGCYAEGCVCTVCAQQRTSDRDREVTESSAASL